MTSKGNRNPVDDADALAAIEAAERRQARALEQLESRARQLERVEAMSAANTGFWRDMLHARQAQSPAQPQAGQLDAEQLADMSMTDFIAMRGRLGVHDAPPAGPSRRPGFTVATSSSDFPDWRTSYSKLLPQTDERYG